MKMGFMLGASPSFRRCREALSDFSNALAKIG